MSDGNGIISVSQSRGPREYNFNTCAWGFGELALDGVTGRGKSGWIKRKWLRCWELATRRTYTKHNTKQ